MSENRNQAAIDDIKAHIESLKSIGFKSGLNGADTTEDDYQMHYDQIKVLSSLQLRS